MQNALASGKFNNTVLVKGIELAIDLGVAPRDGAIKKGVFGDTTLLFNQRVAMPGITTTGDSTCDSLKNPNVLTRNQCNASAFVLCVQRSRLVWVQHCEILPIGLTPFGRI